MGIDSSGLEDLFERAGLAFHVIDPDGTILGANRAEFDLLGYDRDEYVGRNIRDFHIDRATIDDILTCLARGETISRCPARLRAKDGSIRDVEITSSACSDKGTHCLTRDVSVEVGADARRREVEAYWQTVMDAVPAALYITDADGRLTYFNQAAVDMAGRTPTLGSDSWCVTWRLFNLDGTPLPHDECPMAVALKEDRVVRGIEAIAERPDGSRVHFQPYPTPLHDRHGKVIGAVNLLVDVTEQRRTEADAARLAAIVTSSNDAIVSKTLDGVVTSWNQAAETMFGYAEGEMIGQSIRRIIPSADRDEEQEILAKLRRGERVEHYETVRMKKDGSLINVSLSVSPVRDRSGRLIGAAKVARDITQRKQAQETQRLLLNELNHRVKNTLATVQSIASQTLRRTANPADFVPNFTGRVQALANAHTLLTQTNWHGAHLGSLIRSQFLADDIADRITCTGPEVMLSSALALHLGLVLHELGTNARKHGALSVSRGRVALSWSLQAGARPVLHFSWTETGGPPVYVETQPRRGFGTVLIEQSIRAIAGGEAQMRVESAGISWQFSLPLPQSTRSADTVRRQDHPLPAMSHVETEPRPKRVLVVEDEPLIGLDIASSLEDAGYEVIGPISTLDEAIRAAVTTSFNAALLDANLAGQPVDEIAALITQRNIPFAFVTGYGRDNLPAAFAAAPALGKPFSDQALLALIGNMFSREAVSLPARPIAGMARRHKEPR